MFGANVWRRVLGVDRATVIEDIDFDEESDTVVVHVRPRRHTKRRCGRCGARSPGYDQGEGRRNWRSLDLGTVRCFLRADAPRVKCPEHGPTVAQVPWARHGAGHTRAFDDQVAWLVTHTPKSTVCELMRIAWRTVGSIIDRVVVSTAIRNSPLAAIGIPQGRPREFPADGHGIPRVFSWRAAPPPCLRWRRSGARIRPRSR